MQRSIPESDFSRLAARCDYWSPGDDTFLAGEIVSQWSHRESFRRDMCRQQAEVLKRDALLGGLLYQMKKKLCRLGRNGNWSAWLRQQRISRSTADRLVLDYAEAHSLSDEFMHRQGDPIVGNICIAAHRTNDRLCNMLKSPTSRMTFIRALADLFGLTAEWEGEATRLSIPPPPDEDSDANDVAPNVIQMEADGNVKPVNYELRDEAEEDDSVL
jgi:hypothetical protein